MGFKEIEKHNIPQIYGLMKCDFAPDELKPLNLIIKYIERNICRFFGLYENNALLSYFDIIFSDKTALIDYFAVTNTFRGKGVGGKSLKFLSEKLSLLDFIFAEVESPAQAKNDEELKTINRRLEFYVKNGFYYSGNDVCLFGHKYRIMVLPIHSHPEKQEALQRLFEIYQLMFTEEIINEHVSII